MEVETRIKDKLSEVFAPEYLEVYNESHQHNVPANSETHFRVVLVSREFKELSRVARQRRVNEVLSDELAGPVHALSLRTWTPEEWAARQEQQGTGSPACRGGGRK